MRIDIEGNTSQDVFLPRPGGLLVRETADPELIVIDKVLDLLHEIKLSRREAVVDFIRDRIRAELHGPQDT